MSIRNLFFLSFLIFMTGCSSDLFLVRNGNIPSNDKFMQLKLGQNRAQVEEILGAPSSKIPFNNESWIYMSSTVRKVAFFKPEEMSRELLVISFNAKDEVKEILIYNEDDGKDIKIDQDQTSSEGHDIGFFQKYFGGVGTFMPVAPTTNNQ